MTTMTMPLRLATALLSCAIAAAMPAGAQKVAFINPGKSDELYWVTAAKGMMAAAEDLGMQLEVRFTERDHTRTIEIARELAARPPATRPDYAVITNDNAMGAGQLRVLDAAGIRTVFAYSTIAASERGELGGPRERFKGWLGSIEPRAEDAGYLTARALIEAGRKARVHAADGKLHLIALAGDRTTPSSIQRNSGMQQAIDESSDVVLDQMVYAAWNRDKAAEQAEWLLQRHPQARLVWAGSDVMAFGAMQALEKQGGKPGSSHLFSAVNTSTEALQAVGSGRLAALAGGHFICGAWAMVLVHDHARRRDFASEGLEFSRTMFTLFDAQSAARFIERYAGGFSAIDFRRYSKAANPKLLRYDFDFAQFLR
jgi:ABC-type sugar transport system substrate-binding protein